MEEGEKKKRRGKGRKEREGGRIIVEIIAKILKKQNIYLPLSFNNNVHLLRINFHPSHPFAS